jgi:hypothetical protein
MKNTEMNNVKKAAKNQDRKAESRKQAALEAATLEEKALATLPVESETESLEAASVEASEPDTATKTQEEAEAKVKALWKKAQAAKAAAEQGLLSHEKADELWKLAEEASKPSAEAVEAEKAAKEAKQKAERKERAAKDAFGEDLLEEAVYLEAKAEADTAREAYKKAAQAAKGFGPGSGGRCKGLMSGLDAAVKVLQESKEALQVGTICNKAIEQGLWNPEGQTPAATLSAAIQKEVNKGEASRIVRAGKAGYFTATKKEDAPEVAADAQQA